MIEEGVTQFRCNTARRHSAADSLPLVVQARIMAGDCQTRAGSKPGQARPDNRNLRSSLSCRGSQINFRCFGFETQLSGQGKTMRTHALPGDHRHQHMLHREDRQGHEAADEYSCAERCIAIDDKNGASHA